MVTSNTPKIVVPILTKVQQPSGTLVPSISMLLENKFLLPGPILTGENFRPLTGLNNSTVLQKETDDIFVSAWPKNQNLLRESTHSLNLGQIKHKALVYYKRCQHCTIHPCATCPLNITEIVGFQTHFKTEVWTPEHLQKLTKLPITERTPRRIWLHEYYDSNGEKNPQFLILLKNSIPVKRSELDFNTGNIHLQNQDYSSPKLMKMLHEVRQLSDNV